MISRVAASCFWMFRYVERAESTARLLQVSRAFALDAGLAPSRRWMAPLVASGEEERFEELYPEKGQQNAKLVQDYLTWDERNPVSLKNSIYQARENARVIREIISPEMWETLNGFWVWLDSAEGRKAYRRDRDAFYSRVWQACALFQGVCHNTMLHDEPFDFMRLGMLLERCGQTARIVDVRYHLVDGSKPDAGAALESTQWMALLHSCSALEPFLKAYPGEITGPAVADFLIKNIRFPRSIHHCVDRSWNFISRIRPKQRGTIGELSAARVQDLLKRIRTRSAEDMIHEGLHDELRRIIRDVDAVCSAVQDDYFDSSRVGVKRVSHTAV